MVEPRRLETVGHVCQEGHVWPCGASLGAYLAWRAKDRAAVGAGVKLELGASGAASVRGRADRLDLAPNIAEPRLHPALIPGARPQGGLAGTRRNYQTVLSAASASVSVARHSSPIARKLAAASSMSDSSRWEIPSARSANGRV